MFQFIVAALGAESGTPGSVTAAWTDISMSSVTGDSDVTSSTVVFTGGGSRELLLEHDVAYGSIEVKVGTGSYAHFSTGHTISVTTGQTVYFRYSCYFTDESATLTITDNDLVAVVDTVNLDFTFIG